MPFGALLVALALTACSTEEPVHTTRFLAFGTLVDLSIAGAETEQAETASREVEQHFARLHHQWHAWEPGPLQRINQAIADGQEFDIPPAMHALVDRGRALSVASEGLFNPAIGQLVSLWGFHRDDPDGPAPPDPEDIRALVDQQPHMTDLVLGQGHGRSRNLAVKLDFGAYGKGYGIALAMELLQRQGIHNAILNTGGDLSAMGNRGSRPWRVAIRHPRGEGLLATVELSDQESVFTSGDYERTFTHEGKRYHHIIDPRTGWPAEGTASATVIDPDPTLADAAATALFVAGPEAWHATAKAMGIAYAVLVDDQGFLYMNPEMAARLQFPERPASIPLSAPL